MLEVINGVGNPDEVLDRLVNAIDQRRRPPRRDPRLTRRSVEDVGAAADAPGRRS